MGNNSAANQPSGSIVEPSNPRLRAAWKQQSGASTLPRWALFTIIGLAITVVALVVFIIIKQTQECSTNNSLTIIDDGTVTDETNVSEEYDFNLYLEAYTKDPNYQHELSSEESVYQEPPADLTCESLIEVPHLNSAMLSHYIDSEYVLVISAKGHSPYQESGNALLVFGGLPAESTYKVTSITCPDSSDENLRASGNITPGAYETYTDADLLNNITSDRHIYVWYDQNKLLYLGS